MNHINYQGGNITIGIPTWNRSKSLLKTLESLQESIKKSNNSDRFEVLISDNGSIDDTQKVCNKFKESSGIPVKIIKNKTNQGFKENIFKIIRESSCEFIWFVGDDDPVTPRALDEIFKAVINTQDPIILIDSLSESTNSNAYFYWLKNDISVNFESFCNEILFLRAGKISNLIVHKKTAISVINSESNDSFNSVWPHVSLYLYILNLGFNIKISPTVMPTVRSYNNENLTYNGESIIRVFSREYCKLYHLIEKRLNSSEASALQKIVIPRIILKDVFIKSAYLDNYYSLNKEVFSIFKIAPGLNNKFKVLFFYTPIAIFPNLAKRIIIKLYYKILRSEADYFKFTRRMSGLKNQIINTEHSLEGRKPGQDV